MLLPNCHLTKLSTYQIVITKLILPKIRPFCVPADIEAIEIVPIGLALIVYVLVSLLTLKPLRSGSLVWHFSLGACAHVDIEAYEIMPGIESLRVVPGLIRVWQQF